MIEQYVQEFLVLIEWCETKIWVFNILEKMKPKNTMNYEYYVFYY